MVPHTVSNCIRLIYFLKFEKFTTIFYFEDWFTKNKFLSFLPFLYKTWWKFVYCKFYLLYLLDFLAVYKIWLGKFFFVFNIFYFISAESSLMYLFTRYRFNWDAVMFSLFSTYNTVVHLLGKSYDNVFIN